MDFQRWSIDRFDEESEEVFDDGLLLYSRRTVFGNLRHLAVESPMVFADYRVEE